MDNNSNSIAHSEPIPVSDFMTVTVITATENQNVRDVCKLMYDKKIMSIVILENTKAKNNWIVLGIVTQRDCVRLIGFSEMSLVDVPVSEIMSSPLITIWEFTAITDAISVMQTKNIRRLPVLIIMVKWLLK